MVPIPVFNGFCILRRRMTHNQKNFTTHIKENFVANILVLILVFKSTNIGFWSILELCVGEKLRRCNQPVHFWVIFEELTQQKMSHFQNWLNKKWVIFKFHHFYQNRFDSRLLSIFFTIVNFFTMRKNSVKKTSVFRLKKK